MSQHADETTENAIKEDSYETHHHKYHHSPKHIRPGTDDEEGNEPSEKTKTTESETGVPVSDTDTIEPDTDSSEDSEQEHQSEANISNDKTERDEELKDGLEGLFLHPSFHSQDSPKLNKHICYEI